MNELAISALRRDGGTQPREGLCPDTVKQYAEAVCANMKLPAVKVMHDGTHYWLWDGFHRVAAYESLDILAIPVEITSGTQDDAIVASLAANKEHDSAGRRRSNADKRRSVVRALTFHATQDWSDRRIADHVGVSHTFVANVRADTQPPGGNRCHLGRDGKKYTTPPAQVPTVGTCSEEPVPTARTATHRPPSTPEQAPVQAGESEGFTFGWLEFDQRFAQMKAYAEQAMQWADLTPEAAQHVLDQLAAWKNLFGAAMQGQPVHEPPPPPPPPPAPKKPEVPTLPELPAELDCPEVREGLMDWITMRLEKGKKSHLTPTAIKRQVSRVQKMHAKHGREYVLDAIDYSLGQGYEAIYPAPPEQPRSTPAGSRLDPAADVFARNFEEARKRRAMRSQA